MLCFRFLIMVCVFKHLYCSAQLSMSNMEKRYRNKIIIIIIMRSRVRFAPGPRCFNISFVIPSGPGAFFCFIFFNASSSSRRVRHSVMHGSKPAVGVFWSTDVSGSWHLWLCQLRVKLCSLLQKLRQGRFLPPFLWQLHLWFAVLFCPVLICLNSVTLSAARVFGSPSPCWGMLFLFSSLPGFASVFLCLDQPSAGSVFSRSLELGSSPFPLWSHSVPCGSSPRYCSSMACSNAVYLLE